MSFDCLLYIAGVYPESQLISCSGSSVPLPGPFVVFLAKQGVLYKAQHKEKL